jgi:hypothetical protein
VDEVKAAPARQRPGLVGLSRCPSCRDTIDRESTGWVACQRCLARHHDAGCWTAASGCSACGATRALATRDPPRSRGRFAAPAALLIGAVIGLTVAAFADTQHVDAASTPVLVSKIVPAPPTVVVPDHVWERLAFLVNEERMDAAERLIDERFHGSPEVATELREVVRSGVLRVRRPLPGCRGWPIDLGCFSRKPTAAPR